MTAYLIRRLLQMFVVLFLSAVFTYALFILAPGGPLTGLQQTQRKITAEDKARIREGLRSLPGSDEDYRPL